MDLTISDQSGQNAWEMMENADNADDHQFEKIIYSNKTTYFHPKKMRISSILQAAGTLEVP